MRHSVKVIIITIKCFIIVTSLLCHPCKRQMCKSSQLTYLFFGEAPKCNVGYGYQQILSVFSKVLGDAYLI